MFSLKKLFANDSNETATQSPGELAALPGKSALLCREAVFDRQNRLAGHVFRLYRTALLANSPDHLQRLIDDLLLNTLLGSNAAWNTLPAFVPISSASLHLATVDRLPDENLVLLVHLASRDTDAAALCERIRQLRQRGLGIGLCHRPQHPAHAQVAPLADYGIVDVAGADAATVRDISVAIRASGKQPPAHLFAVNIDTQDEHRLCQQWHFNFFHGNFAATAQTSPQTRQVDPHKIQLLNLLRLVQGDAETPELAAAMKQDPVLTYRILRYLNSPAIGLNHRIDSISQALIMLGRQRLTRWLAILLFSVNEANFADWLLVESALTRGKLMEDLGALATPPLPPDPLFLTGIFSCLDRLLHRPLAEIIEELPITSEIRSALLEQNGPYAALLAVAAATETHNAEQLQDAANEAGLSSKSVNCALLAATAWASEVTEQWE